MVEQPFCFSEHADLLIVQYKSKLLWSIYILQQSNNGHLLQPRDQTHKTHL